LIFEIIELEKYLNEQLWKVESSQEHNY
jgi:hypothetical protein